MVCTLRFCYIEDIVVDIHGDDFGSHGFGVLNRELTQATAADNDEPGSRLKLAGVNSVECC